MPGTGSRADVAERALRGRAVGFVLPVRYAGQCGSVRLATGRSSSPSVRVSVRTVRAQEPLSVFRRLDAFVGRVSRRVRRSEFSEHARRILPKALPVFGAVLLGACGYNEFGPPGDGRLAAPLPNMTVSSLRSLCADGPIRIEGSGAVLTGYVTTSDRANNFYRSFFVEDRTGALEVRAGLYDLHNMYGLGEQVALRLDGLSAALDDGLLRIGLRGTDYEPVLACRSYRPDDRSRTDAARSEPVRRGEARIACPGGRFAHGTGARYDLGRAGASVGGRNAPDGPVEVLYGRGRFALCLDERLRLVRRRYRSARAAGTDRYSASGQSRRQDGLRTQNEGSV